MSRDALYKIIINRDALYIPFSSISITAPPPRSRPGAPRIAGLSLARRAHELRSESNRIELNTELLERA